MCVTLEGDVYSSTGTVSGGYMGNQSKNIELTQIYNVKKNKIDDISNELTEIDKRLKLLQEEQRKLASKEASLVEKESELKSISLDSTQQKKSIK